MIAHILIGEGHKFSKFACFNFEIDNCPFINGDFPRSPSYGVYLLSQSYRNSLRARFYTSNCCRIVDAKLICATNHEESITLSELKSDWSKMLFGSRDRVRDHKVIKSILAFTPT